MNNMRKNFQLVMTLLMVLCNSMAYAQSSKLTLEQSYKLARENFPLIKSLDLIRQSGEYSVSNVKSGYLPAISINGQYTYQSDVTGLPISIPNLTIPEIDKNQYKFYVEINQTLYDGGMVNNQKKAQEIMTRIEDQSTEVELYKIRERINQLYFGILLFEGQIEQTRLMQNDIQSGLEKAEAAFANGIVLKSNVDALKAELLKIDQRLVELKSGRIAYLNLLGIFINQPVNEETELEVPQPIKINTEISRPELDLFGARMESTAIQSRAITTKNLPKLNFFFQGGYGSPALNMLEPDANTYYITGVRLAYPLTGFYNKHREKSMNAISKQQIEIQRETFLMNTKLQITQQNEELDKFQQLINTDNEIVSLRESIRTASLAQLENGIITSSDYLQDVTAADNARQSMTIHEIQWLLTQYNHQLITGTQSLK